MEISKTSRLSLVEQVVAQMEALIESGTWPIGYRIPPELELMGQFDVSRNTLREAIRALVHAGLLQTKQGSGTYVLTSSVLGAALEKRIQKASLLETLEVRQALEREAAHLASIRRNNEDIEQLRILLKKCQTAAKQKDRKEYVLSDMLLHKAIVDATHNSILIDLYDHMTTSIQASIENLAEMTNDVDFHIDPHKRLVHAIIDQNTDQAMAAVNEYIAQFKETLT
ncbi:FadR/GntR family transcriptional regulator [Heyndrickxia oleronia]|jgi:DNA-binding FadR family transcriptional regulator|uniref:GntR family transcriptional regulator n=1 Tax=Heyndrickxia oleronia TaxID=38875 RepID=A0A8E2IAF1_9BACI|nr:FadR/GntR family transcriptional regulator [Heyndrickxia oleronia]MCI1591093.1 FadR family transcriptional regulator [Heyndrickxia oleronia]MCI1614681.1 FadR family transcriptional regulator [Heyndrickxia oleronia]MCI1745556.1 FadR family transcriptional regulator [Heyndrickxia oleronia]MCI1762485.1 FadR family transcriptional regulator [Heyndrickxia oleronia]MEC1377517.1 FadR/GntR family transcriptional regulator [Heyndrickxia oleronia]